MPSFAPAAAMTIALIVAQGDAPPSAPSPSAPHEGAADAPVAGSASEAGEVRAVRRLLVDWRDGWERRDLEAFGATIGAAYRSGELDRAGLLAQKKAAFAKASRITVGMADIAIAVEGEHAK